MDPELPGIVKWADLIGVKRDGITFAVAVIGGIWCHRSGTDSDPENEEDQRVLHTPAREREKWEWEREAESEL